MLRQYYIYAKSDYRLLKDIFKKYDYKILFDDRNENYNNIIISIDFASKCVYKKLVVDKLDKRYPLIRQLITDLLFYEEKIEELQNYIKDNFDLIINRIPGYFAEDIDSKINLINRVMSDRNFLENCNRKTIIEDIKKWFLTNDIEKYIISDYKEREE